MSNKKISIHDMEKSNIEFKKSHYVSVSGFGEAKPPKWFSDFITKQEQFNKLVIQRLDKIDSRIDNLEKLVVTQFKQHNWIK